MSDNRSIEIGRQPDFTCPVCKETQPCSRQIVIHIRDEADLMACGSCWSAALKKMFALLGDDVGWKVVKR